MGWLALRRRADAIELGGGFGSDLAMRFRRAVDEGAAQRRRQSVEPITLAGHGGDEPRRLGVGLDLAPQATDQRVDTAVEQFEGPVRDGLEDRVAAQDAARTG